MVYNATMAHHNRHHENIYQEDLTLFRGQRRPLRKLYGEGVGVNHRSVLGRRNRLTEEPVETREILGPLGN